MYWHKLEFSFKLSISLCVFISSSNGPTARRKTHTRTRITTTNVFVTLRQLYVETGDILICLLCVRLMAAIVRLSAEKEREC
jgi:hypothetical protein